MEQLCISAKSIPTAGTYDVIILGGGTSGAFAGIAAARKGMKTLIIEQFGALGGSSTMGLVTPMMSCRIDSYKGQCRIGRELIDLTRELGGVEDNELYFDPTLTKFALEELVCRSGCELMYHTVLSDVVVKNGKITHVIVTNKDGLTAYAAKIFIDCTGDADCAVMAGVPYESGADDTGRNQAVSLRFEMAGIDYDAFHEQMRSLGNNGEKYFAMNTAGMREILRKAADDGVLTEQDIIYFQGFGVPGKKDAMNFNCPELTTKAGVAEAKFISDKQIEGKRAILRLRAFLRKYIRGFENAYITEIAPMVGFRESRRIKAMYTLTVNDLLNFHKFEDGLIHCFYPLDIHGNTRKEKVIYKEVPVSERYWEVPFRSMIAENIGNLLVAGRCAGFDFISQSAARIQIVCRVMGEAAGVGAALAVSENKDLRELPFAEIADEVRPAE